MKTGKMLFWAGVVLILSTGLIHLLDAPDSFHDALYKGWLFYANGIGALVAAYGIYRGRLWGWGLGFFIVAASFISYCLSRTVGLPQIPAEPEAWFEPLGVASLIAEGLFVLVFILKISIGGQEWTKSRL
ncbi:MAG: hypothetical protein ABSB18_05575 [Candidatus Omnitrophota bacterium]